MRIKIEELENDFEERLKNYIKSTERLIKQLRKKEKEIEEFKKVFKIMEELEFSYLKGPEEWVKDFREELYLEREISVWELMAEEYLRKTKGKKLSLEEKREIFKEILNKSFFGLPA